MSGNLILDAPTSEPFSPARGAAPTSGRRGSILIAQFYEFYAEVVRLKAEARNQQSLYVPEAEMQPARAIASAEEIWQRLLSLLEQQSRDAGRSSGAIEFDTYREAQYVMAALADEIFLNLEWDGKAQWPLLESKLFHAHAAGELLFQKIDQILRQPGSAFLDLAVIYFYALALGFQGKFRNRDDHGQLERYRKQLFSLIYRRDPDLLNASSPMFPQAVQNVINVDQQRLLPDPRHWLLLLAAILVIWVGVTALLWQNLINEVHQLLCRINPAACGRFLGGR